MEVLMPKDTSLVHQRGGLFRVGGVYFELPEELLEVSATDSHNTRRTTLRLDMYMQMTRLNRGFIKFQNSQTLPQTHPAPVPERELMLLHQRRANRILKPSLRPKRIYVVTVQFRVTLRDIWVRANFGTGRDELAEEFHSFRGRVAGEVRGCGRGDTDGLLDAGEVIGTGFLYDVVLRDLAGRQDVELGHHFVVYCRASENVHE